MGLGDFPVYYGDRKTGEGGEFRAGVLVPLCRGRDIDPARAALAKAGLDRALAEPSIQLTRIDVSRAATVAFIAWVATGQRYLIARDILRIAETRDEQLGKRIKAGNLSPIEREDNRRIIIDRQARLIAAQRLFQQASIQLSLYLRDQAGLPTMPAFEQLPAFTEPLAPPDPSLRQRDLEAALARRPEIQRLALQRQKFQVDLDLANNQMLPGVNLGVAGAQDVGQTKKDLDKTWGQVGLLVDVPLERRNARGRILATQAEMARLFAQEQLARDRVQVEVQNALNGLDRAYDLLRKGQDNKSQNRYLEEAERRQFDVGNSDLFRVNIRELNSAEARTLEIDAIAEFYRSLADYYAALGIDPSGRAFEKTN
jgi:outer membrane protein TolC